MNFKYCSGELYNIAIDKHIAGCQLGIISRTQIEQNHKVQIVFLESQNNNYFGILNVAGKWRFCVGRVLNDSGIMFVAKIKEKTYLPLYYSIESQIHNSIMLLDYLQGNRSTLNVIGAGNLSFSDYDKCPYMLRNQICSIFKMLDQEEIIKTSRQLYNKFNEYANNAELVNLFANLDRDELNIYYCKNKIDIVALLDQVNYVIVGKLGKLKNKQEQITADNFDEIIFSSVNSVLGKLNKPMTDATKNMTAEILFEAIADYYYDDDHLSMESSLLRQLLAHKNYSNNVLSKPLGDIFGYDMLSNFTSNIESCKKLLDIMFECYCDGAQECRQSFIIDGKKSFGENVFAKSYKLVSTFSKDCKYIKNPKKLLSTYNNYCKMLSASPDVNQMAELVKKQVNDVYKLNTQKINNK